MILNFLKQLLRIGFCDFCAGFSFRLRQKENALVCKECIVELNIEL